MPTNRKHISPETLQLYGLGKLPTGESTTVESHLSICDSCCQTLASLDKGDTFVATVRSAVQNSANWHQQELAAGSQSPPIAVGEFSIIREIGRGGMGVVYAAEQTSLGRLVALKVIVDNAINDDRVERFHREARAAAGLSHPNIVPVYDVGSEHEKHFYAMKLIVGESLDAALDHVRNFYQNDLSTEELAHANSLVPDSKKPRIFRGSSSDSNYFRNVARLFVDAADAFQHAHAQGVVHRDVKPSNFLLDENGRIWLTDFGLAKVQDSSLTQTNDLLGTLRYMPPESYEGNTTPQSDLFGLGLTLYELLSLRPAYDAIDRPALVRQVTTGDIRPIREIVEVPRDLDTVVMKLLRSEPNERYESAAAVRDDLKRFVDGEPILARPTTQFEKVWRWCKHNRHAATFGALSTLLIVAIAVGSSLGLLFATKQSNTIRSNLYASNMLQASNASSASTGLQRVLRLLEDWNDANDLKGWEYAYLRSLLHRENATLNDHSDSVYTVSWHDDGNRLLSASQDGTVKIWSYPDCKLMESHHDHPGSIRAAFWSPDGQQFASAGHDGAIVIRGESGSGTQRLIAESPVNTFAWHPSGKSIAAGYDDKCIRVWNLETGTAIELEGHRYAVLRVAWDSNGKEIISCCNHEARVDGYAYRRWNLTTRQSTPYPSAELRSKSHDNTVYSIASSGNGKVLTGGGDGYVILWDERGKPIRRFQAEPQLVFFAIWKDKNTILVAGNDNALWLWNASPDESMRRLRGHLGPIRWIDPHPKEDLIATASIDSTIKIWNSACGEEVFLGFDCDGFSWGPTSDRFATGKKSNNSVVVTDLHGNKVSEYTLLGNGKDIEFPIDWSDDGKKIAAFLSGRIHVIDPATGETESFSTNHFEPSWIQWCSDNRRLLLLDSGAVMEMQIYDSRDGELLNLIPGRSTGYSVTWSPCGKYIAGASQQPADQVIDRADVSRHPTGPVKIWDAETGNQVKILRTNDASGIAYDPSGTFLAAVCKNDIVEVWNVASETKVCELKGNHGWIGAVAWSPDGRRLVAGGCSSSLTIWETSEWLEVLNLPTDSKPMVYLEWSPDGQKIGAWSWGSRVRVWDATLGFEH